MRSRFGAFEMSIWKKLSAPFTGNVVSWRVGSTNKEKTKGMALAYIDARDVMDRFDDVCGPDGWAVEHVETLKGRMICRIGVRSPASGEWVWKADGAGDTDVEGEKGAISDALKRAAVVWGVGRYLYSMKSPWVSLENGRISGEDQSKLERLADKAFAEWLKFERQSADEAQPAKAVAASPPAKAGPNIADPAPAARPEAEAEAEAEAEQKLAAMSAKPVRPAQVKSVTQAAPRAARAISDTPDDRREPEPAPQSATHQRPAVRLPEAWKAEPDHYTSEGVREWGRQWSAWIKSAPPISAVRDVTSSHMAALKKASAVAESDLVTWIGGLATKYARQDDAALAR
jgi:hypothetical protein